MQLMSMKERARVKEEEVRQMIRRHTFAGLSGSDDHHLRKLELVDTLQRIGLDYHYAEEIDELLQALQHDDEECCGCECDGGELLYVTSLRFFLLRKHGYSVSSGMYVCVYIYINTTTSTI